MAATKLSDIVTLKVRPKLLELTPRFWTDAELLEDMKDGIKDLWGAILDLHGDHFIKITTDPILKANGTFITGVPDDCFRVQLIEPADISVNGTGRQVLFLPRKYRDPDFVAARTQAATDATNISGGCVYYQLTGIGAPAEAPRILTAPLLSADLQLRIAYNPTVVINDLNPIPGESDNALRAWTIAFALAKEQESGQRVPDAGWLKVYATEKQIILTRLTPRQEQEPDVVEDFFQGY